MIVTGYSLSFFGRHSCEGSKDVDKDFRTDELYMSWNHDLDIFPADFFKASLSYHHGEMMIWPCQLLTNCFLNTKLSLIVSRYLQSRNKASSNK